MKITSHAHRDSHAALIELCKRSLEVHEVLIRRAEVALAAKLAVIDALEARPWWERLFVIYAPSCSSEKWTLDARRQDEAILQKVLKRAQYELTIELDDREANILFLEL